MDLSLGRSNTNLVSNRSLHYWSEPGGDVPAYPFITGITGALYFEKTYLFLSTIRFLSLMKKP